MRLIGQASVSMMGIALALALAVGAVACSSDVAKGGTGGTTAGTGGTTAGTGGTTAGTGGTTAGTGGATADASANDAGATMTLTSSALTEGATFAATNTCAGVNTSPPLSWTGAPTGTMSYAVALTDLSINAVHWVIYDIPAATTSLPAALPPDTTLTTPVSAKQIHKTEFFGAGGAYRGPCPSGNLHNYQFEVSAIPTATLGGITASSTVEDVKAAVVAAARARGDLAGTSNASAAPADASGQ